MFKRLYETHINVRNLERSMSFYESLGLERGAVDEARRVAFYFIGGWNESMLGLWEKTPEEIHHQHYAFEVELNELESIADRLRAAGIVLTDFFGNTAQVPTVFGWMPAASYYFSDPDNHELEILARLPGNPRPDLGVIALPEWNARTET